ncbi:MAG: hypothetical protein E7018_02225 [Alphaproteobacteria bacterium]|nr:hypothetical protein [Alphaproteobacteria bacterium]
MTDETNKIVQELFQKSHRFLAEDEVVNAALEAKLSLFETNALIETLISMGVYISDNIHDALKQLNNDRAEKKRTILSRKSPDSATTFSMLHIPVGAELTFLKDREIVAVTLDDVNRIRLKDGSLEGSTSKLAQILGVKFGYADVARQGPRWWLYHGKTLLAIREELEND